MKFYFLNQSYSKHFTHSDDESYTCRLTNPFNLQKKARIPHRHANHVSQVAHSSTHNEVGMLKIKKGTLKGVANKQPISCV